jgi:hypothetical protein
LTRSWTLVFAGTTTNEEHKEQEEGFHEKPDEIKPLLLQPMKVGGDILSPHVG